MHIKSKTLIILAGLLFSTIFLTIVLQSSKISNWDNDVGMNQKKNEANDIVNIGDKRTKAIITEMIHINGSATGVGAHNWTWARDVKDWCSGSGTPADPFVIANKEIDGQNLQSGIVIENSYTSYFRIENNTIYNVGVTDSDSAGIKIYKSRYGEIRNNKISSSRDGNYGIHVVGDGPLGSNPSEFISITQNYITNTERGIYLEDGVRETAISENTAKYNTISGIYIARECTKLTVSNNILSDNNVFGIADTGTNNFPFPIMGDGNTIFNNTIYNNAYGFYLARTFYDTISYNNISSNSITGLYISGSTESKIANNIISDNVDKGILMVMGSGGSMRNKFYKNYFLRNGEHAVEQTNIPFAWDRNNWSWIQDAENIGNYWDNYTGPDADDNGIGETHHIFQGGTDRYPIWSDGIEEDVIEIDATATGVNAHNWTWAEGRFWCSGSGTSGDPYVIKPNFLWDGFIDGGGSKSSISILNSNNYFKVESCTLYNSGPFKAGILLNNTTNGDLQKNNFSLNGNGIFLNNSRNNNIIENVITNNLRGVFILDRNSHSNNFLQNKFIGNNRHVEDNGEFNTWDNGIIGNYWDNYTEMGIGAEDKDDDGIGDIPYKIYNSTYLNIGNDSYPIWDDGHNGSKIVIDGNLLSGSNSWSWAASRSWCTGNGIQSDPYIIEDVNINAQNTSSGIYIYNSSVHFRIENSLIYNSSATFSSEPAGGICLVNIANGVILNSQLSNNNGPGIVLRSVIGSSYNIIIQDNNIKNNKGSGVFINGSMSYNNIIDHNNISLNGEHGLFVSDYSYGNIISNNYFYNNTDTGILIKECEYSIFAKNTLENNSIGIALINDDIFNEFTENLILNNLDQGIAIFDFSCQDNYIYDNNFTGNGINGFDNGISNSWNFGNVGNYWNDYLGNDTDDDGTGDTPYDNINGIFPPYDYFPTWWDAPNILQTDPLIDGGNGWISYTDVDIIKDNLPPHLSITRPNNWSLIGVDAPSFDVLITDNYDLKSTWYRLWNGSILTENRIFNYGVDSFLDQNIWSQIGNGTVVITFFASDIAGNIGYINVTIYKDIQAPIIRVDNLKSNQRFPSNAPRFNLTIFEFSLNKTWYHLNGDFIGFFIGNGTINQTVWGALANGPIIVRFYGNDTCGNIGWAEIIIYKGPLTDSGGSDDDDTKETDDTNYLSTILFVVLMSAGILVGVTFILIKKGVIIINRTRSSA